MATWNLVSKLAAALPLAEPGERHGAPVWRVNGKVFVQLGPRLRVPGEDDIVRERGELLMLMVDYDERAALIHEDPDTFFITPHYQNFPAVLVWLRAADRGQLRELITDAWRARLSKTQQRELDVL